MVVFNWALDESRVGRAGRLQVRVAAAAIRYTLRNAADYYGDVTRSTYDGGRTIDLPMTGHTVSVPYG